MESITKELAIPAKNITPTASPGVYSVVVHSVWLKKWLKNKEVDNSINRTDFPLTLGENVPFPWRKIFIKVISKKISKVLPLPRYKLNEGPEESPLTFAQLLHYVSQNNQRNLWKESYKKYCQNNESLKESAIVNLMEHDPLLSEVILRMYGCNIIRIKSDSTGKFIEYKEVIPNKYLTKSYETHVNLLSALFTLETDANYFIVYNTHYENSLLDCLNFSPNLIDMNYTHGLFIVYQLLNVCKALSDRGLNLGNLTAESVYLNENLWLQVLPQITNNVRALDSSLINEQTKSRQGSSNVGSPSKKCEESTRQDVAELEKLCVLWVHGRISNLDYLLQLNKLAGRSTVDPQARYIVPWVTDFASRCGRNWRDLTKSKYRLTKGDRQLDLTYEVAKVAGQTPHHVTDALSDITCYVYLARRTPKEVLCKHVRSRWVPAEYPASIQRMQEWTPDECIPEFYTDPLVFKSVHEDLPDLGVPSWASCVEDFISKHREALESTHVSENLHHWIDLTFGYKLSGQSAVKCKNVCLSLVDGHTTPRMGTTVQLFNAPHPPRASRVRPLAPATPHRLHWTPVNHKKQQRTEITDESTDEEEESISLPQHVSRLTVPTHRVRARHKSSRARSHSKSHDTELSGSHERAQSHTRHMKVQKSELGKGVIYLPKEFNPVASIQAIESLDNFRMKCFFSKADDDGCRDLPNTNLYPMEDIKTLEKETNADNTAFTNHIFLASYEQNYLKKFTQDVHMDALKERKNRSFNSRYTTDAVVYKQSVTESRRQDMLVVGCFIVEIFLHAHMRPLRNNNDSFVDRFKKCRTVLKYNFSSMPKCVSYVASLLLNVLPLSLSIRNEIPIVNEDIMRKIVVTEKGLPPPTPAQLLQPLLMQHLIPFPKTFNVLYNLLSTLHEYEITSTELNLLHTCECDVMQCEKYHSSDKTKLYFSQRIAEGKIQACATHLDVLLSQIDCHNQFDVLDIFLTHYIELLQNKSTSVLAAWYLFDTVSKSIGPEKTRAKLLKHIVNLYEDDDLVLHKGADDSAIPASKQKFVKLYHNIFLLQLMVRFGLQCFLDNFTQHLVEGIGGYKDLGSEIGSPGHSRNRPTKKPRYSDDTVKNAMHNTTDIFSPDTSFGSEPIITPNTEKIEDNKDLDNRSESEVFHFESDKERLPSRSSRSKSPAESIDSYTLSMHNDNDKSASPCDVISPQGPKDFCTDDSHFADNPKREKEELNLLSPQTKPQFTSYLLADDVKTEVEKRKETLRVELSSQPTSEAAEALEDTNVCKISEMSAESLIWLAHRLGPVLTCRYITRNLLKMLTLCYIGKDNLMPCEPNGKDDFDAISIANSRVVGDNNAAKVISCLTSIVAMYGEQLIVFQYLAHASELIAWCRRHLSAPLEGGLIACLQLFKYLLPHMSDKKLMEQLQDTILKTIIHPVLRLVSTTRCSYGGGAHARAALARKLLEALHVLAVRVGREMTRRMLCVPPLQRFFLIFDKASGKIENWPKQESENESKSTISESELPDGKSEAFLELCRDGTTAQWTVKDGQVVREDAPPDLACSPPDYQHHQDKMTAKEELLLVFNEELAYQAFTAFRRLVGTECLERTLSNMDTVRALCEKYTRSNAVSPPLNIRSPERRFQSSYSDEPLSKKIDIVPTKNEVIMDHISSSNSFGSNVTLVGNRIDVASESETLEQSNVANAFDVVAHKVDNGGVTSSRHLRGDWLIYWEHEIGRPDKENRFNLKQIKLQTFVGHTHTVKSIHCLDNENSFMSGSKDKTVKLWSLRNQGDGNATSQCNWTYTGHKKGVLSLTFLESLRLAVSTDSVVHIWDPFMESVVNQLDHIKTPVSIVRTLPGPSTVVVAATTDATLKIIDARSCNYSHDLKVGGATNTFIRCMCVSSCGTQVACGLASGLVCVLDIRAGRVRALPRPHDAEVLRLAAVDDHRILSSGLDQTVALWNLDDGELITHLKGHTEPVHCLSVFHNELISGTTNNRIGVHTSLQQDASFSSTRLRSDTFKGLLTCMAVLPLNRLLLLGSDNGSISMLC